VVGSITGLSAAAFPYLCSVENNPEAANKDLEVMKSIIEGPKNVGKAAD
jgi:hypothetical protein